MKTFLFLLVTFTLKTGFSQSINRFHDSFPLDLKLYACLDSEVNQTTYGMCFCTIHALDSWDVELNRYYKLLMGQLNKNEKAKMKASQRKWLAYRDAEFETTAIIYNDMQGTMWKPILVGRKLDIVRLRALELKEYYEAFTIN